MANTAGVHGKKCLDMKNKDHCDEIPTINYSVLFSNDLDEREHLKKACQEFGFFYLINGVEESVVQGALKSISDFFQLANIEEKGREYSKKNSMDRIRWRLISHAEENRENLKLVAHPEYHCPSKPANLRDGIGEYFKQMNEVELGLAKAISKILGYEENYIEKELKLKDGFDVASMNLYPPNFQSKGSIGIPDHTDPGLFVSLIQDVNGGLQMLSHKGNWLSVNIPPNAIFISLGDHAEILSNGKYRSHIHRVIVDNNQVRRMTMATVHGPSLDTIVSPAPGLIDESHPPAYRGVTYKEFLELNGDDEIDVQSSLSQLRTPLSI